MTILLKLKLVMWRLSCIDVCIEVGRLIIQNFIEYPQENVRYIWL